MYFCACDPGLALFAERSVEEEAQTGPAEFFVLPVVAVGLILPLLVVWALV